MGPKPPWMVWPNLCSTRHGPSNLPGRLTLHLASFPCLSCAASLISFSSHPIPPHPGGFGCSQEGFRDPIYSCPGYCWTLGPCHKPKSDVVQGLFSWLKAVFCFQLFLAWFPKETRFCSPWHCCPAAARVGCPEHNLSLGSWLGMREKS